ncbi:hypothetical protein OK414_23220 [Priestia sp. JV24]|uniref:hypothetical protein n=1 Tax=Priestia TaxID=2800373 RepID=UPI0021D6744E|nr:MULTISPECIES: hypothetical protein [Priestia]MCU7708337.1 hypothetical protein [Priestia megaterium]MCW1047963.1 hypothetical protein [Priestia sp. JV24]
MKVLDDYLKAHDNTTYYTVETLLTEENRDKLEAISIIIGDDFEALFINEILRQHFKTFETELNVDLLNDSHEVVLEALADRRNSLREY